MAPIAKFDFPRDIEIPEGQMLTIIGANGAGKTTLLRAASGLPHQWGVPVRLNGEDLASLPAQERAKRVAFLPSRIEPFLSFSVFDVVLSGRYPFLSRMGAFSSADRSVAEQVMERLCVEHLATRSFAKISSGEQQRVLIASAIAQGSQVLALDEPSVFLDPLQEELLYRTLRDLQDRDGMRVFIASHNLRLTVTYSDQVIGLFDGRVVFRGAPPELQDEEIQRAIYGGRVSW